MLFYWISINNAMLQFRHNDFPMALRELLQNDLSTLEFNSYLSDTEPFKSYKLDHTDLKRLRDGHVGGQVGWRLQKIVRFETVQLKNLFYLHKLIQFE